MPKPESSSRPKITIYSKPECHLCDEAKRVLQSYANKYSLLLKEVNIEEDPVASAKYRYEIPVIFIDDVKLFKYRVDEKKLMKAIESRLG